MSAARASRQFASTEVESRLSELAELLGVGLVRLRARQSRALCAGISQSALDCVADQSGGRQKPTTRGRAA